jgi:hypothetical protein
MVSAITLSESPGCTTLAHAGSWTPGGSGIVVVVVDVVEVEEVEEVVVAAVVAGAAVVGGAVVTCAVLRATAVELAPVADATVAAAGRSGAAGWAAAASTPAACESSACRNELQPAPTTSQPPSSAQGRLRFTAVTVLLVPVRESSRRASPNPRTGRFSIYSGV